MFQVTWLFLTNPNVLFQHIITTVCWNLFMTLCPVLFISKGTRCCTLYYYCYLGMNKNSETEIGERETKTVWTRKRKKDMEANRIELQRHRNRFRQTAAAEASFVLSEKIIQVFYFSSLKPPSVLGKDKGCNLHASPCQNSSVFILKICRNIQITLLK